MWSHPTAWIFLDPVPRDTPGYYDPLSPVFIEQPMDLSTIKKKMDARTCKKPGGSYSLVSELEADLALMFDNCVAYNSGTGNGEYYVNIATALRSFCDKTIGDVKVR